MIVCIDGTGPDSDADYAKEMGNSFVSQISKAPGAIYFRGPTLTGSEVSSIADRAVGEALRLYKQKKPVMIAGYSRGGCASIIACDRLASQNIRVDALFLFDAVDMQTSEMGLSQIISSNVNFVAHARTARDLGFWVKNPVKSRFYFYNTGRWLAGDGEHAEKSFVGTHGAAGGVPWPDVKGDRACALNVAEWMNGHLKLRVPVTLKG